jgi:hypothetical protein
MDNRYIYSHCLLDKYTFLSNNKVYLEDNAGKAFVYADNSNVYAEGCRVSAVNKKLPFETNVYDDMRRVAAANKKIQFVNNIFDAMNNGVTDRERHLNYVELYKTIASLVQLPIASVKLWGSPPPDDPFWGYVRSEGFEVTIFDRNSAGKEKKVDVAVVVQMMVDAYTGIINKEEDELFLLAGDTDYVPAFKKLINNGFKCNVIFWDHAGNELKSVASKFISLNPYFTQLAKD